MKKRAVNWWSLTSTILLCLSAPFLWNTGTLGGGERGKGRGEAPGEVADVGEASVNGEREGEGEIGVDMMPGGYCRKKRGGGRGGMDDECQYGEYVVQAKDLEHGRWRRGGGKNREKEWEKKG